MIKDSIHPGCCQYLEIAVFRMNLFVCLVQGMSKQAGTNRAPTDSLGWGPTRQREVLVQLQPRGGQGWGSGVWQLEMGSVHSRVPTLTWGTALRAPATPASSDFRGLAGFCYLRGSADS